MRVFWRFLLVELTWAAAILVLIVPVTVLSAEPLTPAEVLGLLARALELALFPAGIAVARAVFSRPFSWRAVFAVGAGIAVVSVLLLELWAIAIPHLEGGMSLRRLAAEMNSATSSWEARNDAAWSFYGALLSPVYGALLAAIGSQVGVWACHALPPILRRLLYWTVGLGLIVTGYALTDSTYEVVVLHTAALVDFAAFYRLLVPAGICAGLALPTLALLRGAEVRGSAS
jgi:hypothetical protein